MSAEEAKEYNLIDHVVERMDTAAAEEAEE